MLMWDKPLTIAGVTVYGDDRSSNIFYVLPHAPRFRLDDNGLPVFKFLKYREAIDRPNPANPNKKGGGFCIFDVEFVVPDDVLEKVKAELQEKLDERNKNANPKPRVEIGQLSYTRGAAKLQMLDSGGGLVEKIQNPGAPSLYGHMITPFTVELSPGGATLAEEALQDKGGIIQVIYDLFTPVKLPPVTVTVWFNAEKFMHFHQEVHIDWNFWGDDSYRESIQQSWRTTEVGGVELDPGTVTDQKVLNAVRDWGWQSLDDAVKRMVLSDIPDVSADDRKVPEGMEHVWRDQSVRKVASFRRTYKEGQVMEWNPSPRGTLPNITSLKDKEGKPLKWSDFAKLVDLDDPFFRQLNVSVTANADFQAIPIHSVDVHLDYHQGDKQRVDDFHLTNSNDVGKFATFIENNQWKYKYRYQVNYKGSDRTYKSPEVETDSKFLTINVGDTGFLEIRAQAGDLNFEQVDRVQVVLQYEDTSNNVPLIEDSFTLDKAHTEHKFSKLIFAPVKNAYKYRVKYFMKDGKEYSVDWQEARSMQLFINDPFSANRSIGLRGIGDFQSDIATIFVDLNYVDEKNKYSQKTSVALNKTTQFLDWVFPVIDESSGKITFSGTIQFQDGKIEEIKETESTKSTILVGKPRDENEFLSIQVIHDLLDFSRIKLAKVALHYVDSANGIDARKDLVIKKTDTSIPPWSVRIQDRTKKTYEWQATYFMSDGSQKKTTLETTGETSLVLEVPV
ncbi:MAG TPA: hypothetical protein VGD38_01480 [Pyrinomonadaceae bacterium]